MGKWVGIIGIIIGLVLLIPGTFFLFFTTSRSSCGCLQTTVYYHYAVVYFIASIISITLGGWLYYIQKKESTGFSVRHLEYKKKMNKQNIGKLGLVLLVVIMIIFSTWIIYVIFPDDETKKEEPLPHIVDMYLQINLTNNTTKWKSMFICGRVGDLPISIWEKEPIPQSPVLLNISYSFDLSRPLTGLGRGIRIDVFGSTYLSSEPKYSSTTIDTVHFNYSPDLKVINHTFVITT